MKNMASGDIDDTLGPGAELDNLRRQNIELDQYLIRAWQFKPVRTFFIPFGAGISNDGERVYISYDIQTCIDGVECENALVRHETTEWALREFAGIGKDYAADPSGHRLANRAEFEMVAALLAPRDDPWGLYSEIVDEQVINAERTRFDERPIPQDLALYPYSYGMRGKLQEAMLNDRSWEEWAKIYNKPLSKEEVHYTDHGTMEEHCANCKNEVSATVCAIVRGDIVPNGWCDRWVARHK